MERIEFLLSEILKDLREHHLYVRTRNTEIDAQDNAEKEEEKTRCLERDKAMMDSLRLQQEGLALVHRTLPDAWPPLPKPPEGKAS